MNYLFEVSWEVCNKVGGIHTVLRSKMGEACREFGENYFLLGPALQNNQDFKETQEPVFDTIRQAAEKKGLHCRFGRWQVPGEPKAILVDFQGRYDVNKVLYGYWRDFGVDSYAGRWDYMEPVLFSTACGEVIEVITETVLNSDDNSVAHFHEWMCGGGLLYLKKSCPEVGLVFTTHATMLGRCISGLGRDITQELDKINPMEEAKTYGVSAKHHMEVACAREADCFTTVSRVTGDEAAALLGKQPDLIVENGFNMGDIPDYSSNRADVRKSRDFLLHFCRNFLQKDLPENTRLWITSGRYEFYNKGYDVFLESLGQLDRQFRTVADVPPVVALFLICAGHRGVQEAAHRRVHGQQGWDHATSVGITTHHLHDEQNDPVVKACNRLGLNNGPDNKVDIIFSTAYLDGHDGIFDSAYEDILRACDLGVFTSFYEPWGYTPLEAIAHAVPTITTDLAGFGDWASGQMTEQYQGVSIVPRKGQSRETVIDDLTRLLHRYATFNERELDTIRTRARQLALRADWGVFYAGYKKAYAMARDRVSGRFDMPDSSVARTWFHLETPRYRSFTVISTTPRNLQGLYEIAQNLWWSWNPDARELFQEIDQGLWISSRCNPIQLLNQVSSEVLAQKSRDKGFLARYHRVYEEFQEYMKDTSCHLDMEGKISSDRPIAYFSMEYGLHECLPIYSGGLGVLSGDHLKSASDLNLPLIGVGLFYKQGYFSQAIDSSGMQRENYPALDCSMMPIKKVMDGESEARISVKLPGRTLLARCWLVQVGRTRLYLLDSDVEGNEPADRGLSGQLYGGDRRTRIKQEMLVGIGGARLIKDVLRVTPAVYHMNEGHCAFLTLERVREMLKSGLNFYEAREAVRSNCAFTTHTPVPAGNEVFDLEILEHYMRDFITAEVGIQWEQFVDLGFEPGQSAKQKFSMTVLALKMSSKANGVAKLHGKVSRDMWKSLWRNMPVEEVPIFPITNGIHTQTWMAKPLRQLFDQHLFVNWGKNEDEAEVWAKVKDIPDEEIWNTKQAQKKRFIELIKAKIADDYARRGESSRLIRETIGNLSSKTLTVGFARRFATYKRATLFLRDLDRISRILQSEDKPVQFIFAGKAHPADTVGKEMIKAIVQASRSPQLKGRLIYLENYDMGIGRLLTRGVDVWMNNPIRPLEASGTSGMKVCPNGGINFSILDGWWDEAYAQDVGWKISSRTEYRSREQQDEMDNLALLDCLEQQIVPLYYMKNEQGFSPGWVAMMKNSIGKLTPQFSTLRMLKEYVRLSYLPVAEREALLSHNDYSGAKALTGWKQMISARFATVQIARVEVRGIRSDELIEAGGTLDIHMYVQPGKLSPQELRAEFVLGIREGDGFSDRPEIIPFQTVKELPRGEGLQFSLSYTIKRSGNYLFAARVVPVHELLASSEETGLMCWG